jgi:glycosyltransferase involved in cell wall biosynthesis
VHSRSPEPRILYLLHRYPPAFGGGPATLSFIRNSIRGSGFISIVLTGNRGIKGGRQPGVYRLPSVGREGMHRVDGYTFAMMAVPMLMALHRRYDLIHTMGNGHHVYLAILLGELLGKPVIVSSVLNQGDDPSGIVTERFGRLKNAIFSRAAAHVCLSGMQLEAFRNAGYPDRKVHFIPNGIEPARFRPCEDPAEKAALRVRLDLPRNGFTVVSVGAIIERKGIHLLAEAWIRYRSSGQPGTLVLVGPNRSDDPGGYVEARYVRMIQERFSRAGVAESVVFTGQVANVEDYLRSADLFTLLSHEEGFPLALLEAMASGLPFLLWDLPIYGGYDLRDGFHGFLVPPFDTTQVAERLGRLSASPESNRAMGRQACSVGSQFTLSRNVAAHVALYRTVAAQRGKPGRN